MKAILKTVSVNVIAFWLSLVIAYNSYKEIMKPYIGRIPKTDKTDIKLAIFWTVLFLLIILLVFLNGKKKDSALSLFNYTGILILHAIITNLVFINRIAHIRIIINLGELFFIILILIFYFLEKRMIPYWDNVNIREEGLQSVVAQRVKTIYLSFLSDPTAFFVNAFIFFLSISALLLIFNSQQIAEDVALIAYFALVTGVGFEGYKIFQNRNSPKAS